MITFEHFKQAIKHVEEHPEDYNQADFCGSAKCVFGWAAHFAGLNASDCWGERFVGHENLHYACGSSNPDIFPVLKAFDEKDGFQFRQYYINQDIFDKLFMSDLCEIGWLMNHPEEPIPLWLEALLQ